MKTIYKYVIPINKNFYNLKMPLGAEILAFQVQNDMPVIWALLTPENEPIVRHFAIRRTGENMNDWRDTDIYIGTIQMPPFVWHLFETKE